MEEDMGIEILKIKNECDLETPCYGCKYYKSCLREYNGVELFNSEYI